MNAKRKLRYQRARKTLGRHIKFRRDDQVLFNFDPDPELRAKFKPKDQVSRWVYTWKRYRRHKMIEDRVAAEQIGPPEHMFDIQDTLDLEEDFHGELVSTFSDPHELRRPLRHVCWLGHGHVVGAYADTQYRKCWDYATPSYLWDIEISSRPLLTLVLTSAATCIECQDEQSDLLISGHLSGGLALWDVRVGPCPVAQTEPQYDHPEIVTCVQWTLDEGGHEVFSGGSEGSIRWWDTRYLTEPLEVVITDVNPEPMYCRALGVTALEVNTEEPHKYLVGTQSGHVMYGDRMTEFPSERLQVNLDSRVYIGPVYSVERHEDCPDVVVTAGDFRLKLFSDELMHSAIMSLRPEPNLVTWGTWSPSHPAVIHATRDTGHVDTWNLQVKLGQSINTLKVCNEALIVARCRQEGDLLAVGSVKGDLHLIRYTDNTFLGDEEDEVFLDDLLGRECGREKQVTERAAHLGLTNSQIKVKVVDEKSLSDISIRTSEISASSASRESEEWEDVTGSVTSTKVSKVSSYFDQKSERKLKGAKAEPEGQPEIEGKLEVEAAEVEAKTETKSKSKTMEGIPLVDFDEALAGSKSDAPTGSKALAESVKEPSVVKELDPIAVQFLSGEVEAATRNFWKLVKEHKENLKKLRGAAGGKKKKKRDLDEAMEDEDQDISDDFMGDGDDGDSTEEDPMEETGGRDTETKQPEEDPVEEPDDGPQGKKDKYGKKSAQTKKSQKKIDGKKFQKKVGR
ncbi:hypothetical protein M8J76_004893 [Diaphorina citri]|nr:hypothetical protein M8J76_004893 [Diaphorina citri]